MKTRNVISTSFGYDFSHESKRVYPDDFDSPGYTEFLRGATRAALEKYQTAQRVKQMYQERGLVAEYVHDKPGTIYEPHSHEATILFTLSGEVVFTLEDLDPVMLQTGREFSVGSGRLHEAVVGSQGWEYIAAWDPIEAEQYNHD
jgi:quercetin dioxygenase-like cupin family protein